MIILTPSSFHSEKNHNYNLPILLSLFSLLITYCSFVDVRLTSLPAMCHGIAQHQFPVSVRSCVPHLKNSTYLVTNNKSDVLVSSLALLNDIPDPSIVKSGGIASLLVEMCVASLVRFA